MDDLMEKLLLLIIVLLNISPAFSATDTRSIRTSTAIVTYGDSVRSMILKLGYPKAKYDYTQRNGGGKLQFITDYLYTIDGVKYKIKVTEGQIIRIVLDY
jgi:hypothetical protein